MITNDLERDKLAFTRGDAWACGMDNRNNVHGDEVSSFPDTHGKCAYIAGFQDGWNIMRNKLDSVLNQLNNKGAVFKLDSYRAKTPHELKPHPDDEPA